MDSDQFELLNSPLIDVPQITLVLPPEVRLIDKLADRAVQDCGVLDKRSFNVGRWRTDVENSKCQSQHRPGGSQSVDSPSIFSGPAYHVENWRLSSGR